MSILNAISLFSILALSLPISFPHLQAHPADGTSLEGWMLPPLDRDTPPSWLGDDPVLGRLVCPPLTRLNLEALKSESLFLHRILVKEEGKKQLWLLSPRNGLYWWDGKEITSPDLMEFIRITLPRVVEEKSHGAWTLPPHQIAMQDEDIRIIWESAPSFGPYIFNGMSLYKKEPTTQGSGFAYQCAGWYVPQPGAQATELVLIPSPGYTLPKPQPLYFQTGTPVPHSKRLRFKWPFSQPTNISANHPSQPVACSQLVPTPWISGIIWQDGPMTSKVSHRELLTHTIPRGALLRGGAGFWGDLVSAMIPRTHPGYDHRILVRPFQSFEAKKVLQQNLQGKPWELVLSSQFSEGNTALVEKIIFDSYTSLGIKVTQTQDHTQAHGILTSLYLPLPQLDFYSDFLMSSTDTRTDGIKLFALREDAKDTQWKRLLEDYSLSLTQGVPDFSVLKAIHKKLYDREIFSPILHHQVCLESTLSQSFPKIDANDPDWFKKLLLN